MDTVITLSFDTDSADSARERPSPARADDVVCTADVAECTCPDFCERDHGNE